jgi:hypothetical protein
MTLFEPISRDLRAVVALNAGADGDEVVPLDDEGRSNLWFCFDTNTWALLLVFVDLE